MPEFSNGRPWGGLLLMPPPSWNFNINGLNNINPFKSTWLQVIRPYLWRIKWSTFNFNLISLTFFFFKFKIAFLLQIYISLKCGGPPLKVRSWRRYHKQWSRIPRCCISDRESRSRLPKTTSYQGKQINQPGEQDPLPRYKHRPSATNACET